MSARAISVDVYWEICQKIHYVGWPSGGNFLICWGSTFGAYWELYLDAYFNDLEGHFFLSGLACPTETITPQVYPIMAGVRFLIT